MSTPPSSAAKGSPDAPENFARLLRGALFKGFVFPVALLAFFAAAPHWLEHKLHEKIAANIQGASDLSADEKARELVLFAQINLAEVCRKPPPSLQRLHDNFEKAGICGQFARLRWGFWLSLGLVVLLVAVTFSTWWLNRRARGSHEALIAAYRRAWGLCTFAAITKVFLLIPLLAYGIFEFTTLLGDRYYPQAIAAIVIGGLVALWKAATILLKKVPLEFDEQLAREVAPTEAPELWQAVRAAAAKLNTAPPDRILVGMQLNFYVTELAVKHAGGRAEGRTLYLSHPLLRQLAPDEVLGIIGHELGHFRGDDTRITREFYPMRFKVHGTLNALSASGWVGWTSVHTLLFFNWSFGATEQEMSRERELLADGAGAELTSAEVMGRALVRVQVMSEAFNVAAFGSGGQNVGNPLEIPLAAVVQERLLPRAEFWTQLFEKKAPHPLDSHPALRVRLEALGQPIDPSYAMAVATAETGSAYGQWFEGRDTLFRPIAQQAAAQINRVREQASTAQADYGSVEGRKLLDQHFPEVRWRTRPFAYGLIIVVWVLFAAGFAAGVIFVPDWFWKIVFFGGMAFCGWGAFAIWRRHQGGEFVLRADGLTYQGWRRPLLFSEVESLSAVNNQGMLQVTFMLKKRTPWIWKHSIMWWFPQKGVTINLSMVKGDNQQILQTMYRYLTRQIGS